MNPHRFAFRCHGWWPVHKKDVKILDVQRFKRDLERLSGVMVPIAPELGNDGDFFPWYAAGSDGLANDALDTVILSSVDEPVA